MATIADLFAAGVRRFREPYWVPGQWLEFTQVNEEHEPDPLHGPWLKLCGTDQPLILVSHCQGADWEAVEG